MIFLTEKYTDRNVLVTVKGTQNVDGEDFEVELTCEGYYKYAPEGSVLYYTEAEETGFEDTDTTLEIKDDVLTMARSGGSSAYLYLKRGERYTSMYTTPYGNISIGVKTKKINIDINENGGIVEAAYSMDVPPSSLSENTISITIKPL